MKTIHAGVRRLLAVLILIPIITATAHPILPDLSPAQISQIQKGQMVVISQDVPGGLWPKLTVYTLVNAPVQAVNHVFTDYAHASSYIPDLISAKVVARPQPDVVDVQYTTRMPVFGQTTYTVRNTFSKPGNAVVVKWTLLQSALASQSDGSLHVEPYDNGSILRYSNVVQPKYSIAALAKGAALSSVKNTVAAIKKEAEANPNAGK